MLNCDEYTKTQIIEIGTRRFRIPQSRLARASKKDALMSVAAALDHERSLEVIAREAGRGVECREGVPELISQEFTRWGWCCRSTDRWSE